MPQKILRGQTVRHRHVHGVCGQTYSGNTRTVDKLVSMHKKVCPACRVGGYKSIGDVTPIKPQDNMSKIVQKNFDEAMAV